MPNFAVIAAGNRVENILSMPEGSTEFNGSPVVPVAADDIANIGDVYDPETGFPKQPEAMITMNQQWQTGFFIQSYTFKDAFLGKVQRGRKHYVPHVTAINRGAFSVSVNGEMKFERAVAGDLIYIEPMANHDFTMLELGSKFSCMFVWRDAWGRTTDVRENVHPLFNAAAPDDLEEAKRLWNLASEQTCGDCKVCT